MEENYSVAEIEIHYRTKRKAEEMPKITCSTEVSEIMKKVKDIAKNIEYKEMFYAIYMNNANRVIAVHKISEGSTTATTVDLKFIIQGAIMTNATSMIVCHNHPSGSILPSGDDRDVTNKIKEAADLFSIRLMDHVIITKDNYYSFGENGAI